LTSDDQLTKRLKFKIVCSKNYKTKCLNLKYEIKIMNLKLYGDQNYNLVIFLKSDRLLN